MSDPVTPRAAPARVVILGMGGLGCPAALALAEECSSAALPLELVLVDPDRVERTNLSRQILYGDADLGRLKVEAAAQALRAAFAAAPLTIIPHAERFDEASAGALLEGAALLLDGTDSFQTRFLANDRACAAGVPLIHGAVVGWTGQVLTVLPGRSPCLRCLFEGPPPPGVLPGCAEAGVVSPLCGLIGAAMAAEALRLLRGEPAHAAGALLRWESLRGRARRIEVPRDPSCAACDSAPSTSFGMATFAALRHQ